MVAGGHSGASRPGLSAGSVGGVVAGGHSGASRPGLSAGCGPLPEGAGGLVVAGGHSGASRPGLSAGRGPLPEGAGEKIGGIVKEMAAYLDEAVTADAVMELVSCW